MKALIIGVVAACGIGLASPNAVLADQARRTLTDKRFDRQPSVQALSEAKLSQRQADGERAARNRAYRSDFGRVDGMGRPRPPTEDRRWHLRGQQN